jgi:hypothetical protein
MVYVYEKQRWEYKVIVQHAISEEELNALGAGAWELVAVVEHQPVLPHASSDVGHRSLYPTSDVLASWFIARSTALAAEGWLAGRRSEATPYDRDRVQGRVFDWHGLTRVSSREQS